jgi:sugar phosphate isomerase/epimerase
VLHEPTTVRAIERVAAAGYRAIELSAQSSAASAAVRSALAGHDLDVVSLCSVYSLDRDCAHPDARLRRAARDYIRESLELAEELGAQVLVVVPTYRVEEDVDREAELGRAAETIAAAVDGLPADGPVVALEALNRYETHLLNTLADADALRRRIDSPRVSIMADVFHMNIEEDSLLDALRRYSPTLAHVHLADNQRRPPGTGSLDCPAIADALAGYSGSFALEFDVAGDADLLAARLALAPDSHAS